MQKTYRDNKNQIKDTKYFQGYVWKKTKTIMEYVSKLQCDCNGQHVDNRYAAHMHFRNAAQKSVELYNAICNVTSQLFPRIYCRVLNLVSTHPKIERNANVTRIIYDKLLPIRMPDYYLHEAETIREVYCRPIHDINCEMIKSGMSIKYSQKVVICFMHHLAAGSYPMGEHAYATKQIIDCLTLCFLYNDGPESVSLYTQEIIEGVDNYSEIYIVPFDEFTEFIKRWKRNEKGHRFNETIRDRSKMVKQLARDAELLITESILAPVEEFLVAAEESDHAAAFECISEMIKGSACLVASIKMVMHQFGIRFIRFKVAHESPKAKIIAREGCIQIRLEYRLPHRMKGNTCNMQLDFPYLSVNGLDKMICDMDRSNSDFVDSDYVVCFLHHYGSGARMVDHDNIETLPYYDLVTRYLPEYKRNACGVYMDAIVDENNTYSEVIIMTEREFLNWIPSKQKKNE